MDGGMTRRMKAHVSTMLTESGLSIAPLLRYFNDRHDEMAGARRQARHTQGLSA